MPRSDQRALEQGRVVGVEDSCEDSRRSGVTPPEDGAVAVADQAVLVEEAATGVDVLGGGAVIDSGDPNLAALLSLDRLAGGARA